MKWKMKQLETELSIAKTNEKNSQASVGSVTETGTTKDNQSKDLFLEGFDD